MSQPYLLGWDLGLTDDNGPLCTVKQYGGGDLVQLLFSVTAHIKVDGIFES